MIVRVLKIILEALEHQGLQFLLTTRFESFITKEEHQALTRFVRMFFIPAGSRHHRRNTMNTVKIEMTRKQSVPSDAKLQASP